MMSHTSSGQTFPDQTASDDRTLGDAQLRLEQGVQEKQKAPRNPLKRLGIDTDKQWVNWVAVAVSVWLLITAVGVIGDGFKAATGDHAEELFAFAQNPLIALMVGILATALIQSSSTTTSIVVGMMAGGLPVQIAIPMLMGANVGTTLTSTLVSLGMVRDKDSFRRGFAAASVHDMFNLLAVLIFLPLELMFGLLEKVTGFLVSGVNAESEQAGFLATGMEGLGTFIGFITEPGKDLLVASTSWLPETIAGIAQILIGIALILGVVNFIGALLKVVMVGKAKDILHKSLGRGPISGIGAGMIITMLVQSSSTTTALVVPLAGSNTLSIRQVYPFTIGANIGTTITALIAAFAFTGLEGQAALQGALIHLMFNVFAALVIYGIPGVREIPLFLAQGIANIGARNKLYIAAWVLGMFLVLPGVLILLTTVF